MFGAIYIGLSGLNAYSRGLQQISNNVSNLNSLGFKGSAVSFIDLFGVSDNGGLSFSRDGGDAGNGVNIGQVRRDFRPGELRQTDRDLDLAIDGTGFLVLLKGEEVFYTRTGSFELDKDGFVVLAGTEFRLATLDDAGNAVSLSIDDFRINPPKQTTTIVLDRNLAADDNPDQDAETRALGYTHSEITVFDPKGGEHVWKINFKKKPEGGGAWDVTVTDATGKSFGPKDLKFNVDGIIDPATSKLVFEDADNNLSVTLDLSNMTSFAAGGSSNVRTASVDGFKVGTLVTIAVNEDGQLELGYSNEQKEQLGPIAIADFRNPQALEERSGGVFADDGRAQGELLQSKDPLVGQVLGRRLEASNVDLAKQFGDLIMIQRGFQASSQIISVSNDMIQQLFGIRGQG